MSHTSQSTMRRAIHTPGKLALPILLLIVMFVLVLGRSRSYAAPPAQKIPGITITATAVHVPAHIPAGMVAVTLVNDTRMDASAGVARENPGATPAAISAASASNTPQSFMKLLQLLTFAGGPDSVPPGARETAILDLHTPGHYVLDVGSVAGGDQLRPFTVVGAGTQPADLPVGALPILLKDMKFVGLPKRLAAGAVTFKLTNLGPSAHEITLARLDPGKTIRDVANLFKGPQQGPQGPPPWAHDIGGLNMISEHQTAYLLVTLTPGTYVALCLMPDVRPGRMQGAPHAAEGMLTTFVVD